MAEAVDPQLMTPNSEAERRLQQQLEVSGTVKLWSNCGQTVVKLWSNCGQMGCNCHAVLSYHVCLAGEVRYAEMDLTAEQCGLGALWTPSWWWLPLQERQQAHNMRDSIKQQQLLLLPLVVVVLLWCCRKAELGCRLQCR
jgi:hypothetical protein